MKAISLNKFIEFLKNGSFSDKSEYSISLGTYSLDRYFRSTLLSRGKRIGDVYIVWKKNHEFLLVWDTKLYEVQPNNKYLDLLAFLISEKTGWRRIGLDE